MIATEEKQSVEGFFINVLRLLSHRNLESRIADQRGVNAGSSDRWDYLAIARFLVVLWQYPHKSLAITSKFEEVWPALSGDEGIVSSLKQVVSERWSWPPIVNAFMA